jgi:iron complex outermembrane recepter protein
MIRALPGVSRGDQNRKSLPAEHSLSWLHGVARAGTPQGLAVYQNGARINETFGDTVNWNLIPEMAVNRLTLTPNNPVYGLNALGGASQSKWRTVSTDMAVIEKGEIFCLSAPS